MVKIRHILTHINITIFYLAVVLFANSPVYASETEQLYLAAQNGDIQSARALLNKGVNVNVMSRTASYPINAAAVENDLAMIELLIANGADLNVQNGQGDTPLICATKYGGGIEKTVKLIVDAGADVSITDNDGKTALDYAIEKKQTAATKLIK